MGHLLLDISTTQTVAGYKISIMFFLHAHTNLDKMFKDIIILISSVTNKNKTKSSVIIKSYLLFRFDKDLILK